MTKDTFRRLHGRMGSRRIALAVGVTEGTVRRWRSQGPPKSRDEELRQLAALEREGRRSQSEERKARSRAKKKAVRKKRSVKKRKKVAKKKYPKRRKPTAAQIERSRQRGLLEMLQELERERHIDGERVFERPKSFQRRFHRGDLTSGYEAQKRFWKFLTRAVIGDIREWVEDFRAPKRLPRWMVVVQVSQIQPPAGKGAGIAGKTEGEPGRPYETLVIQLSHPQARMFLARAVLNPGWRKTKSGVVSALVKELRATLDQPVITFVQSVRVYNYRQLSEEERAAVQAQRRRQAREQQRRSERAKRAAKKRASKRRTKKRATNRPAAKRKAKTKTTRRKR